MQSKFERIILGICLLASYSVSMESDGVKTYYSGDSLQMKPGALMDARNPSDERPLKLSVFQVGKPDAPFVVPVE